MPTTTTVRFAFFVFLLASTAACDRVPEPDPIPSSARPVKPAEKPDIPLGKVQSVDVTVGTGAEAKTGNSVKVHYTGTLTNGTKFDSSRDRNEPFGFTLGRGEVIKGWDQGVVGMKVGGKRKLTIPYDLAYGEAGQPPSIPGKSTLVFDVELMDVKP